MSVTQLDLFREQRSRENVVGEAATREGADGTRRAGSSSPTTANLNREQHPAVRVNDPDTCVEPDEVAMSKGQLVALRLHAEHASGLTDFELAEKAGIAQTSIGKRRCDLVKLGMVVGTTLRRSAPSGAAAIVWQITPVGIDRARRLFAEVAH